MFKRITSEELRVPARIESLGELRDFVTKIGNRWGISEKVINAFKLSTDEAATNIIKHAYRDWDGDITIRAISKRDSLSIVLIDQGKYFDPRQVSEPDLSRYVKIGKKGGLGIFMMRRLLDDIDYRKTESGNELWMTKQLERPHKKIAVTTIPVSLKMRYWLYAMGIFAVVLVLVYFYLFFNQKQKILNGVLEQGKNSASVITREVANKWQNLDDPSLIRYLKNEGSEDVRVWMTAQNTINTLRESDELANIVDMIIIDKTGRILASFDSTRIASQFQMPSSATSFRENVYLYTPPDKPRVVDIVMPVQHPEDNAVLARAHYQMNYDIIYEQINDVRMSYLRGMVLVFVIGAASLFLLIYLVMNPFRRLQDWVKRLGQSGVIEEMDIDDSTEVGSIAKAFSDITIKLRESQANLAEQERLQQEMHVAKEIQQTLLPAEFPQIEGYDISSHYGAAKEVGGDYYDFVEVDQDTLGIVVADVSGKGVPGSLVMTMIRTALRTEARGIKDAAEVLARVNDFVVDDMKKGMFVTLFYVIVDSRHRRLNFASAGHNPMILYRASTNKTYYLNPRGFPIGISLPDRNLFRHSLESDTIALTEDDTLIVYTDGVTEAMNRKRELFGEERFLETIRKYGNRDVEDFVDSLRKELNTFTEGFPQNDDITLVALKEKTSVEKVELKRAKKVFGAVQTGMSIKEACQQEGLSTYAYYNKYKERFEQQGVESFTLDDEVEPVESIHLSIEEKTKIYDIVQRHPDYGAKRISEELNTERYGYLELRESRIYDELVRMRLNTKELREAFVARGGKRKRRMKPPGTPMMTIDGKVIMQKDLITEPEVEQDKAEEKEKLETGKPKEPQKEPEEKQPETTEESTVSEEEESPQQNVFELGGEEMLTVPLENLLAKPSKRHEERTKKPVDDFTAAFGQSEEPKEKTRPEPAEEKSEEYQPVEETEKEAEPKAEQELEEHEEQIDNEEELFSMLTGFEFAEETEEEEAEEEYKLEFEPEPEAGKESEEEAEPFEVEHSEEEKEMPDIEGLEHAEEKHSIEQPVEEELSKELEHDIDILDLSEIDYSTEEKTFDFDEIVESELAQDFAEHLQEEDFDENTKEPIFEDTPEQPGIEEEEQEPLDLPDTEAENPFEEFYDETVPVDPFSASDSAGEQKNVWEEPENIPENEDKKPDIWITRVDEEEPFFSRQDESFDQLLQKALSKNAHAEKPQQEQQTNVHVAQEWDEHEHKLKIAKKLYNTERYDGAIEMIRQVLAIAPDDDYAHYLLGNSYFHKQHLDKAAQEYENVLNMDPLNESACENLAVVYAKQGNLQAAIQQWKHLLHISPGRTDIKKKISRASEFLKK